MKAAKDKKARLQTPSNDLLEYLRMNNLSKTSDAELSERFSRIKLPATPLEGNDPVQPAAPLESASQLAARQSSVDPNNRDQSQGPEGASKTQKSLKSLDLKKLSGPEGIPKRDPNYKPPTRDVSPADGGTAKPPVAPENQGTQPTGPKGSQPGLVSDPALLPRQSATILPTVQPVATPKQESAGGSRQALSGDLWNLQKLCLILYQIKVSR